MAVPEQTPFIEYTANGTTTVYPLTFDCDKSEYLIVSLDGEEAPVGSWSLTGESITFNSAPANGVLITIERNTPFRRTTEYQSYNNSFRPSPVNKDFDLIWWKLQELGYRDQVIWLALVKEIADRIAGDTNLQNQINTIDDWLENLQQNVNENTSDIAQLVTDLSKEIADRIANDDALKEMFLAMMDEAINEGTINALAITHLDSLEDLEEISNVWDGRTIYVKDLGNYRYDALTASWVKAYQDADNVKCGDKTQKQINDQIKAKLGHFKLLQDYITPDMTDHTQAILLAISENDFLDFGTVENTYYVSQPISLRSGMTIISNGAKFVGKFGIQGAAPYTARGIIDARNLVDTNMYGVVQTFIDHTEFSSLGDATNKPTIIGFLGDACTDCDFGLFDSVGSVNYYYAPNFKEYGIVDLRNSTDCIVRHKVDGRYKQETVSSTPSTVGVFGINNTRCISIGSAKNTYWSGILWGGIDCKIISPVVRNTKGSNINLGGINTNAYNVDLKTSEQGNVSIGEGTDTCYSCSVFGGTIGDAQYANVALHNSAQNCKVFADIYGWGQIKGAADVSKVGVRVRGKGNTITVSAKKVRDGYTAFGDACNVHSTTLVNPDVDGNIINIVSEGAGVSVRAPNTVIDVDVTDATTVNALYMGYRCAGSEVKRVRAKNCLRPFVYEPDTATPADYANVYVGSIISIGCVDESVTPLMNYRRSGRARDVIESMSSSLVLNDVLYALEAYSHDSSITGTNKLAAAIRLLCTDAFGTSHGVDILTSTLSAGVLVNKAHKFRIGSFEIEAVSGSASSLICVSPDGTRYKLQPANGGGAATWVVAT